MNDHRPPLAARTALLIAALAAGLIGGCTIDGSVATTEPGTPTTAVPSAPTPTAAPSPVARYRIALSTAAGFGDGWREAMICSAKAEATASGLVTSMRILQRDTDLDGQLEDIRALIADGVDAIVIEPASADGLGPALDEAERAGVVVVAVDRPVSTPTAFSIATDQAAYAYLGASWLFEQLGGEGNVVVMRGITGDPKDVERDIGFQRALQEHPGIKVVKETQTEGDPETGVAQINDLISGGTAFEGIWTSGVDTSIIDALSFAGHVPVPIVGGDRPDFILQLIEPDGPTGAMVTDPPAVGGAGVALALDILAGVVPVDHAMTLAPQLQANTDEDGRAALAAAIDPTIDPSWPVSLTIPGRTRASAADVIACRSPGA